MSVKIPSKSENPEGLHVKYRVGHEDGSPMDPDAVFFVLRLDSDCKDPFHLACCRAAARAYAHATEGTHLEQTGKELLELINRLEKIRSKFEPEVLGD